MIFVRNFRFLHEFCTKFQVFFKLFSKLLKFHVFFLPKFSNSRFYGHPEVTFETQLIILRRNLYDEVLSNNDEKYKYLIRFWPRENVSDYYRMIDRNVRNKRLSKALQQN